MKKKGLIIVLAFVLALSLCLVACGETAPSGSVSGTVTAGGIGIEGVTVSYDGSTATTDAEGAYSIDKAAVSGKEITFTLEGYMTVKMSIAATEITDGKATIDAELERKAEISGTIKSGLTNAGLAGATVTLLSGTTVVKTATTGDDGAYTIDEIQVAEYTVKVTKDGYTDQSKRITANNFRAGKAAYNATLNKIGKITGKVTNASGAAVAGATVTCSSKIATTAEDGTYTIEGLTINTAQITFEKEGLVTVSKDVTKDIYNEESIATINATLEGEVLPGISKADLKLLVTQTTFDFQHRGVNPFLGKWTEAGDVQKHDQGMCPHAVKSGADMTSFIYAQFAITAANSKLTMSARHFTEQGAAGRMGVKVVDTTADAYTAAIIPATTINNVDNEGEWAAVDTDYYKTFVYDLSAYEGKTIIIAIGNSVAGHCCISRVKMTAMSATDILPFTTTDDAKNLTSLNKDGENVSNKTFTGKAVFDSFYRVGGVGNIEEGTHLDADRKVPQGTKPTDNANMDNYIYARFSIKKDISSTLSIKTRCFIDQALAAAGVPYLIVKVVPYKEDGTVDLERAKLFDAVSVANNDFEQVAYDLSEFDGKDVVIFIGAKYGHKLVINPVELVGTKFVTGTIKDANGAAVEGATVTYGDATFTTGEDGKYTFLVNAKASDTIAVSKDTLVGTYTFGADATTTETIVDITVKVPTVEPEPAA